MAVQIQYRRGLASEWTGINPTLALGEPGYETDTGKIKIGTGSLAWNDLVYTAADSFLNGEGAPDASLGKVGDFYLDTTIYHLYGPKTATVGDEWGDGAYLTGNTIRTGTTAPDASIGRDGDFYIDTVANQIYGPKTDTVGDEWGSPTNLQVVSIDDLGDVDTSTTAPQAGEALVWDDLNSVWKPGPAGAEASGSAGQIQYNDGATPVPGLAASDDLVWDDAAKELSIGGDINLDDGGSFTTTIQCVTPTLTNKTISFPDRTGTVALVAGSNGQLTYNDAGVNAGDSGLVYDATSGSLTVGGKTVSTNAPVLNLSQTWDNSATTFTGLKLNVTNTASASGSNLLDLQVGGTSKVYINSSGNATFNNVNSPNYLGSYPNVALGSTALTGFGTIAGVLLANTAGIAWTSASMLGDVDTVLRRDDAGILAQRNGTNAQTFRLYNTWANNGDDFERGFLKWDSDVFEIGTEEGGTGAARNLRLSGPSASSSLTFSSAGITTVDHVTLSSAFRAGGNTTVAINGTYQLAFTSTSTITSSVDAGFTRDSAGVVKITDGSTGTGYIKQVPVAISALPDPTDATGVGAGTRGFVNDASSTTFAAEVAPTINDGGSTVVPVYSDGSTWRIG